MLDQTQALVVHQQKEMTEIFTGFETRNRYVVRNEHGQELCFALEEKGNIFLRWFLKALRPFSILITDLQGALLYHLVRPFRFFFHEMDVFDQNGGLVGKIKKRFSIVRRIYSVFDATGREVCELFGPVFHPWTFKIRIGKQEVGKITKKWSGLFKEGFTDADNFGVTFPAEADKSQKALMLGAVFLIDFVHFENKNKSN